MSATVLEELKTTLPPILFRNHPRFREWIGLSPRTLANLDSVGKGPRQRIRSGKTIGYPRDALLAFLEERLEVLSRPQSTNEQQAA